MDFLTTIKRTFSDILSPSKKPKVSDIYLPFGFLCAKTHVFGKKRVSLTVDLARRKAALDSMPEEA